MPVRNLTGSRIFPQRVQVADTVRGRITGLLGTDTPDPDLAVHFVPCNGIHTYGMRYPVDVVFLDRGGTVLRVDRNLAPNRLTGLIPAAASALEFAGGALGGLEEGDRIVVEGDAPHRGDARAFRTLSRWPVNLFLAMLWSRLIVSAFSQWQESGGFLSLGLVIVNTLFLMLFLTRRESRDTSNRLADWAVAVGTVIVSMTLRPHPAPSETMVGVSVLLQGAGIAAMAVSLFCLGRSFGIVPANRSVKCSGVYRFVRHPLYASELLFYFGFLLGNPSPYNFAAVFLVLAGQIWRAAAEERILRRDAVYGEYMDKVRYRLIPGVY